MFTLSSVEQRERERERRRLSYWLQRGASSSSTSSSAAAAVLTPSSANISFFHPPLFLPTFCLPPFYSIRILSIHRDGTSTLPFFFYSTSHHIRGEGGWGKATRTHVARPTSLYRRYFFFFSYLILWACAVQCSVVHSLFVCRFRPWWRRVGGVNVWW